jgi:hypothetical protein
VIRLRRTDSRPGSPNESAISWFAKPRVARQAPARGLIRNFPYDSLHPFPSPLSLVPSRASVERPANMPSAMKSPLSLPFLAAFAMLPLVFGGLAAGAQMIGGRAVDRVNRLPARDVDVQVLSDRDSIVSRSRTDTLGEFYADLPSPGTFRLRFLVDSVHTFDSAPVTVRAGEFGQHLFVIDIRQIYFEFQVEKQVRMAENNAPPRYPAELRSQNIEGEVLAQFVVDTMGLAELQTFRPLRFTNPLFVQAVRDALPMMRYLPAEMGGHKVKQLVQQPFTFGLSGGPGRPAPDPFGWAPRPGAVDPLARRRP